MKTSQLIRELAEHITREGDIEVTLFGDRLLEVDVVYRDGATCVNLT